MMSILHICSIADGGAAHSAIRLHRGLLKANIDSKVLFIDKPNAMLSQGEYSFFKEFPSNKLEKFLLFVKRRFLWRIKLIFLSGRPKGFEWFSTTETHYTINKLAIFKQAQVIQIHIGTDFVNYESFFIEPKAFILTLHDMHAFTGGCHYSSGCEEFVAGCRNCPQLATPWRHILPRMALSKKQRGIVASRTVYVAPSKWLLGQAAKSKVFEGKEGFHIPYGINVGLFKNDETEPAVLSDDPRLILLFVAQNVGNKRKGFDLLLAALQEMKVEKDRLAIHIVGSFSDELNLPYEVISYGYVHDEVEKTKIYNNADFFVAPSREDNLPNTVLEALACGLPVVGFNTGGLPDLVVNNFNGILVDEINASGLSDAIERICGDSKLLSTLRNNASKHFKDEWIDSHEVASYLNLYARIHQNEQSGNKLRTKNL
ncbi:MAG: glycosyltransferase [Imperialibacter sp.]|uniref:glycosyltransferase n=1 Tax=Imperialibacter sp. TaxID=2038411 RepID=UPI0032ECE8F9